MLPYLTPRTRAEEKFNTTLCRTRVTNEQAFGILKRRFPCLQVGLRVQPDRVCATVIACVILHNLGIDKRDIVDPTHVNRRLMDEVALPDAGRRKETKTVQYHIANTFVGQ
ncbi:uncharacterized protein LOC130048636 [Ostrea edulis]|uniref:uncharacterized protein LOC130048636 n=1 Tax=Ostrea edulis TaxID=37623 RepID=UPI0024AEAF2C|nr:uncharacterized protein LOC130048636 [Ostrea edulis]